MYIRPPYGNNRDVCSKTREGRWIFLRKVFSSLAIQLVLTVVVASIVVFVRPVADFFVSIPGCLVLYICSLVLPITVLCHLHFFYQSHRVDMFSLGVFTAAMSFAVGLTCAFTKGFHFLGVNYDFAWEIIFESVILTSIVVISLTVYTFWTAKHARKLKRMEGQFSLAAVITLVVFALIQIFFPLRRILLIICGGLAFLILAAVIILVVFALIQIFFPHRRILIIICGGLAFLIFCGYMIYIWHR